jgi:hypothetical protein
VIRYTGNGEIVISTQLLYQIIGVVTYHLMELIWQKVIPWLTSPSAIWKIILYAWHNAIDYVSSDIYDKNEKHKNEKPKNENNSWLALVEQVSFT